MSTFVSFSKGIVLSFLSFLLFAVPTYAATNAIASTPAPAYHPVRLFYYREGELAKKSFFAHPSSVDVFAPQSYKINDDGTLSGTVEKDVLDFAKVHKIKVMPLVTNGGFSRAGSKAFLGDSARENIAIQAMLAEARDRGYWGWQFDFEQMDASDRDLYTAFIQKAYAAFKAQNLMLSVAVIAQVSENEKDYKEGLWDSVIGVYDYRALSASADFLSIMSYDDPSSKGAVAPFPWYERVFTWSIATIPNNKISFGIPLYYWQWNDATGKLVGIGGNEGIDNVFKNHKVTVTYDPVAKAPALHYTKDGTPYTLWYENAKSVTEKYSLVKENRLYGISAWALGLEIPSIHMAVKQ